VADNVTKQLISGGKIQRGYIGATIQNFTTEMAEAQGLGDQRGAIVSDLVPGGPSQRSGLATGDLIVAINGRTVKSSSELTREVAKARPGDVLRLDVIRDGRRRQVEVRSGVRPSESELASNDNNSGRSPQGAPSTPQAERPSVLGLGLAPLDEATRRRLNMPDKLGGVLVDRVDQSSDAAQKGLRAGDVIVRAGDRQVASAGDLSAVVDAAKRAGRTSVLVGVFRNGRTTFLPLKLAG
jgi:serine protease Do